MVELGKRFERLLFFTAPITIAAFVVLAVAVASQQSSVVQAAPCYSIAADIVSDKMPAFQKAWNSSEKDRRAGRSWSAYRSVYSSYFSGPRLPYECYKYVRDDDSKKLESKPPQELLKWFRNEADVASKTPLEMFGVVLPRSTSFALMGNVVQVELVSLSRILQIVMFPVLMLWLGSLYQTRHRESIYIASTKEVSEVFPHFMNIYVVGVSGRFSKRDGKQLAVIIPTLLVAYACLRASLGALFVIPATLAYSASLVISAFDLEAHPGILFTGALGGSIALVTAVSVVVLEFHPRLSKRIYLTPYDAGLA